MWPGAYGSMDDQLVGTERENYTTFANGNLRNSPRYKYLQRPQFTNQKYKTLGRLLNCSEFPYNQNDKTDLNARVEDIRKKMQQGINRKVCREMLQAGTRCTDAHLASNPPKCLANVADYSMSGKNVTCVMPGAKIKPTIGDTPKANCLNLLNCHRWLNATMDFLWTILMPLWTALTNPWIFLMA